jgi:hypothetical protein
MPTKEVLFAKLLAIAEKRKWLLGFGEDKNPIKIG